MKEGLWLQLVKIIVQEVLFDSNSVHMISTLFLSVNFPVVAGGAALLFSSAVIGASVAPLITNAMGLFGIGKPKIIFQYI